MADHHRELSDQIFMDQFAAATLPPALFNHEAHLRLAWLHLRAHGLEGALISVRAQIINYVTHLGAADKYHETLTLAAVRVVHHFMGKQALESFDSFIATFPRVKTHFRELIATHYGVDILQHPTAQTHYLEPDLLPFS